MTKNPTPRLPWADAVRGFCVLAVVLSHFIGWGLEPVAGTGAESFWEKASGQLTPIRMPTLFVLSGFLLSSRVRAGFTDRRALTSAATSYYLYVVWLALFGLIAAAGVFTGVSGVTGFVSQLLLPRTILWFVLGLAFWTLLLAALHRVHPAAILIALGALSIASFWLPGQNGIDHYERILQYGFFFGLGVYGKPVLSLLAGGKLWRVTAGAVLGYIVARMVMSAASDDAIVTSTLTIVRDTAAVVVAIVAIAAICRLPWARVPLVWVGRRTLPIYVMHAPMIAALTGLAGWDAVVSTPGVAWAAPLVGTVVISAIAVAVHAVLTRSPLRALFELPSGLKRRLGGQAVVPSSDGERARHR
jgi:peptidoglycan/LPS O-acetylase OafA/YrhL